jgi:hypothetical protein
MSREELESTLNNAEYHLAECEMGYDKSGDEWYTEPMKYWFNRIQELKQELKEMG